MSNSQDYFDRLLFHFTDVLEESNGTWSQKKGKLTVGNYVYTFHFDPQRKSFYVLETNTNETITFRLRTFPISTLDHAIECFSMAVESHDLWFAEKEFS